jgi:hypothetical protein
MARPERRKEPRVKTDLNGVLRKSSADEVLCRVANLSRSGALAVSSRPLPEMSQVRIRIQVEEEFGEESSAFNCEAAVVRCDRRPDGAFDLGLFFTSMKESDRGVLEELLKTKPIVPAC